VLDRLQRDVPGSYLDAETKCWSCGCPHCRQVTVFKMFTFLQVFKHNSVFYVLAVRFFGFIICNKKRMYFRLYLDVKCFVLHILLNHKAAFVPNKFKFTFLFMQILSRRV